MKQATSNKLTLIGVPIDLGADNPGVAIGPRAFRYQKIVDKLNKAGFDVTDAGDVKCGARKNLKRGNPRLHYMDEIVRINEDLAQMTDQAIKKGQKVVALGGDHSMNLGVVSGASVALKGNLGLIYLDAHGDMNTDKTSPSGNIHGMHVASLMGFGAPELKNVYGKTTKIATQNLLHVGGCDLDQAEIDLMDREGIPNFKIYDLLTQNLGVLFKMIDDLVARVDNIWVSLDLDVIDSIYAPGAGMPNAKGLSYREIVTIAEYIASKCPVVGVDVVEYDPLQDSERKTAELGIELIAKFLGKEYSWYTNYLERNQAA